MPASPMTWPPPGIKGEGPIAFGGGQVIGDADMAYLREFDAAQFDDDDSSTPAPAAEQKEAAP